MRCLAWKLEYTSGGAGEINRLRYVIATERGIMKLKVSGEVPGRGYIASDFDRATWPWSEHATLPTSANKLWEHPFLDEIERQAAVKSLIVEDLSAGRPLHLDKLNRAEGIDRYLDDQVPGGEDAWAYYMRLSGLDQDPEIRDIIASDHTARELERIHGAYAADNTYGMF